MVKYGDPYLLTFSENLKWVKILSSTKAVEHLKWLNAIHDATLTHPVNCEMHVGS